MPSLFHVISVLLHITQFFIVLTYPLPAGKENQAMGKKLYTNGRELNGRETLRLRKFCVAGKT